jgi:hypothetical protein
MTQGQVLVTPIFATPFVVVPLAEPGALNEDLAALLPTGATEARRDPGLPRDPLCFRSREDLFEWQHPAVAYLREEIMGALCAAVRAANLGTEAEFNALRLQVRARFNLVRPDGYIAADSTPLASWALVYCVAAPAAVPERRDSGALRLYALRQGSMFLDASNSRLKPVFSADHQFWQPVPGQMAVFPASVVHEIALNRGSSDLILVTGRARFASPTQEAMPAW